MNFVLLSKSGIHGDAHGCGPPAPLSPCDGQCLVFPQRSLRRVLSKRCPCSEGLFLQLVQGSGAGMPLSVP